MSHRSRLLIDADDVLVNFRMAYIVTVWEVLKKDLSMEQCCSLPNVQDLGLFTSKEHDEVWAAIESPGWAQRMHPMEGAIEAVQQLSERYEIAFVTRPLKTSPTWGYDRYQWIKSRLGTELAENLHTTRAKYMVDGDCLIDDNVQQCTEWIEDRVQHSKRAASVIMFAWPYNEKHGLESPYLLRLPNWGSILQALC